MKPIQSEEVVMYILQIEKNKNQIWVHQGSQPKSRENPYSRFQSSSGRIFYIGRYYEVINSSESPYYYHIFYICRIENWFLVH